MSPTWEVSSVGFRGLVENLSKLSGRDYMPVLIDQTGALLKVAMRLTPAASRQAIVKRASRKANYVELPDGSIISLWKKAGNLEMYLETSNFVPKKGQSAPRLVDGKSWHNMSLNRWSNARWARYQAGLAYVEEAKRQAALAPKARGLSKQSWYQIAQDLSLDIGAQNYVKKAMPSNGRTYKNGTASRILEASAAYIEIANNNPIVVNKLNGFSILERAIRIRLKAFEHDVSHGVFNDIATRARRYPGIFMNVT